MKIKRSQLYETLQELCAQGKYSVGLHGISLTRVQDFYGFDISLPDVVSTATAKRIVEDGLRVESARTINGTVAFMGRLDNPDDMERTFNSLSSYWYGSDRDYIIVATPIEFECEDGRTLYVGATNLNSQYKRYFDTTGSEISTVLDRVILTNGATVDPKFILGRFKKTSDEEIELEINPEHISQSDKKMSVEEFDSYVREISLLAGNKFTQALLSKDFKVLKEVFEEASYNPYRSAYILETITQLLAEGDIRGFTPEDYTHLMELKQKHQRIIEENRRYQEEKRQRLERMANYNIDEIREFALNNYPTYFQDFPDSIRNNVELMRELTKTPGLNAFIVYYLGKDVQKDPTAMINLVNNCTERSLSEYIEYGDEPNTITLRCKSAIGLDVRTDRQFWESLNTRILESNKENGTNIPCFNTDEEIRIATELKAKKTQK